MAKLKTTPKGRVGRPPGVPGKFREFGTDVIWPKGIEVRYGISKVTRWVWEQEGKLPPRDVFLGDKAVGWRPATIDAAQRGEYKAPKQSPKRARA